MQSPQTGQGSSAFGAFKDLVIDAGDADRSAAFWAAATGLRAELDEDGPDAVLQGTDSTHTIWVNQVPEPQTVKQRVHLDLHAAGVADLTALGATVDTEHQGWTVMRDPEGGEFCAFDRPAEQLGDYRIYELVIDAVDAAAICAWWGRALGLQPPHDQRDPWHWLDGGAASGSADLPWDLIFHPVPEPKTVKNRIHWDVWGDTADYLDAGATLLRRRDDQISWDVLADPEGNEFCVFTR